MSGKRVVIVSGYSNRNLATALINARIAAGYPKQTDAIDASGGLLNESSISRDEGGTRTHPFWRIIVYAKLYGVSIDYLASQAGTPRTPVAGD